MGGNNFWKLFFTVFQDSLFTVFFFFHICSPELATSLCQFYIKFLLCKINFSFSLCYTCLAMQVCYWLQKK